MERDLEKESFPLRVENYKDVSSTNDVIKKALSHDEPEGLVVRALRQSKGYGRQGRTWESPAGGLYCSWLLRPSMPANQLSTLSLVTGLSLRKAIVSLAPFCTADIVVKWPNDVLCSQGKLCGISLEACSKGLCLGVGVNVFKPSVVVRLAGKNTPAYLADYTDFSSLGNCSDESVQKEAINYVFDAVAAQFTKDYVRWQAEGFAAFQHELNQVSYLQDKFVRILNHTGSVLVEGRVVNIDEQGCLVVQTEEGDCKAVAAGEAHLV